MLTSTSSAKEVLDHLLSLRKTENLAGMARFGIVTDEALGLPNPLLRQLARVLKTDNSRADQLWASSIREARLLASFTTKPAAFSLEDARRWANDLNSWKSSMPLPIFSWRPVSDRSLSPDSRPTSVSSFGARPFR